MLESVVFDLRGGSAEQRGGGVLRNGGRNSKRKVGGNGGNRAWYSVRRRWLGVEHRFGSG